MDVFSANAERLRNLAGRALDIVVAVLDSPEMSDRLKAAQIILKAVRLDELPMPDSDVTVEAVKIKFAVDENDANLRFLTSAQMNDLFAG